MNRILRSEDMLQRWAVVLLLMAVPAFAWGQKKTESAPKAAPQRSAPAKAAPSRPAAQSHGATTSRGTTTGSHGTTPASRPNSTITAGPRREAVGPLRQAARTRR